MGKGSKDSHKKRIGGREKKFTAQQIIEALELAHGIQASAARNLNTSRATVARYIKDDPDVAAAYEQVNESTIDFAESRLFQAINDGNITAIIFFLKTKAKQRGYIENDSLSMSLDLNQIINDPNTPIKTLEIIANGGTLAEIVTSLRTGKSGNKTT